MIAVKLDEDLPNDLIPLLAARNVDVTSVRLQGWTGRPDQWLLSEIQAEGRWLMTADKGFADIRRYPPGTHHGIICLRADRESRSAYMALAASALDTINLSVNKGTLIVVTARGIRIVRHVPPMNH